MTVQLPSASNAQTQNPSWPQTAHAYNPQSRLRTVCFTVLARIALDAPLRTGWTADHASKTSLAASDILPMVTVLNVPLEQL